jgi:hypothetical protein
MASIYTNLRTERQYRASTGLSEQTFNPDTRLTVWVFR